MAEVVTIDELWKELGYDEIKLWGPCEDSRYLDIFYEEIINAGLEHEVIQLSVPSNHYTDLMEELRGESKGRGLTIAYAKRYEDGNCEIMLPGQYLDEGKEISKFYPKHWTTEKLTRYLIRHELAHIKYGDVDQGKFSLPKFFRELRADWYAGNLIKLPFLTIEFTSSSTLN